MLVFMLVLTLEGRLQVREMCLNTFVYTVHVLHAPVPLNAF